jgi:hypothetical protein
MEKSQQSQAFKLKKNVHTGQPNAPDGTVIKVDGEIYIKHIADVHMASFSTINHIIHKVLGLIKKSARWMSKLLSQEQKGDRVRCTKAIIKLIQNQGKAILGSFIIMGELVVSFHTPESKNLPKKWLKKGTPGSVLSQVHTRRSKQVVLAFLDNKGMVYTYYIPRGKIGNANNTIKAPLTFQKALKMMMPELRAREPFSQWANALSHPLIAVKEFWA